MMPNLLKIANALADKAGFISRKYFRTAHSISLKKNLSAVTKVDLLIEQTLRDYLTKCCPDHSIEGEEYDSKHGDSEYTWVIDPIDGTAGFACGKPIFCTLIALLRGQTPVIGIIDQPITRERWQGIAGKKTMFNAITCSVSKLNKCIKLSCTTPEMFNLNQLKKFEKVRKLASVMSFGGDGYAYGLLASGHVDVILEANLKFYDVAALIPVIEGMGGIITDWKGRTIISNNFDGTVLATGNKKLHKIILSVVA